MGNMFDMSSLAGAQRPMGVPGVDEFLATLQQLQPQMMEGQLPDASLHTERANTVPQAPQGGGILEMLQPLMEMLNRQQEGKREMLDQYQETAQQRNLRLQDTRSPWNNGFFGSKEEQAERRAPALAENKRMLERKAGQYDLPRPVAPQQPQAPAPQQVDPVTRFKAELDAKYPAIAAVTNGPASGGPPSAAQNVPMPVAPAPAPAPMPEPTIAEQFADAPGSSRGQSTGFNLNDLLTDQRGADPMRSARVVQPSPEPPSDWQPSMKGALPQAAAGLGQLGGALTDVLTSGASQLSNALLGTNFQGTEFQQDMLLPNVNQPPPAPPYQPPVREAGPSVNEEVSRILNLINEQGGVQYTNKFSEAPPIQPDSRSFTSLPEAAPNDPFPKHSRYRYGPHKLPPQGTGWPTMDQILSNLVNR